MLAVGQTRVSLAVLIENQNEVSDTHCAPVHCLPCVLFVKLVENPHHLVELSTCA